MWIKAFEDLMERELGATVLLALSFQDSKKAGKPSFMT